jgi:hypothetical protein
MRPNGKTSHKRDKKKYRKNERHHHVFALPFRSAPSGLILFRPLCRQENRLDPLSGAALGLYVSTGITRDSPE